MKYSVSQYPGMAYQLQHLVGLLVLHLQHPVPVQGQQCGVLTTPDTPGPFFVPGAELDYAIAPAREIRDRRQGVILQGQVRYQLINKYSNTTPQYSDS